MKRVVLQARARTRADIVIDNDGAHAGPPQPRPVRLIVPGQSVLSEWRAAEMYATPRTWVDLGQSCTVSTRRGVEVHAPDGRRWKIRASDEELAAGVLELPSVERRCEAELRDWATGLPLSGYVVWARAGGSYRTWAGIPTDATGRFTIPIPDAEVVLLTVEDPDGKKLRGLSIRVTRQRCRKRGVLQFRVPLSGKGGHYALESRTLTGVVSNADGSPHRPGAGIHIEAVLPQDDGVLLLSPPRHSVPLNDKGEYSIEIYVAESYEATVYIPAGDERGRHEQRRFSWSSKLASRRDFRIE